ncbi:UrcA family protein [Sphingomonas yabuuchiae]|uniref:UrcA family protein n=1 Tax=Sphingomonas yabuuchiae TaxID=172044 RepID=UPI0009FE381D|nr:UrcA family protein [Sphingomonas yabuuchiae]
MKSSLVLNALLLSACATQRTVPHPPPDMVVHYADLSLETPAGRAKLVERLDQATRYFCAAYDPQDETAIFDPHLASARYCRGYATILLLNRAPAAVRRAYRESVGNK